MTLKNDLTSSKDELQQEVNNLEGSFNVLKLENKNLILNNEKLKENITTNENTKRVKQLQLENNILLKVLTKSYEGDKCLEMLINNSKCPFNKTSLGFNDKPTNPSCSSKFVKSVKPKNEVFNVEFNSEKKRTSKTNKVGPNSR